MLGGDRLLRIELRRRRRRRICRLIWSRVWIRSRVGILRVRRVGVLIYRARLRKIRSSDLTGNILPRILQRRIRLSRILLPRELLTWKLRNESLRIRSVIRISRKSRHSRL